MLTGGFFEAKKISEDTYDRAYTASQFAGYFSNFIGNGVFGNPANQLKVVSAGDGTMKIIIRAGNAYMNGYWAKLDEDEEMILSNAVGTLSRYDAVILRVNFDNRLTELFIRSGNYSTEPARPSIVRNENVFELCLAYIFVGPAVLEITDSVISDKRPDNSVCGFVTGMVKQIETTELFKQYDDTFYQFYNRESKNFIVWTDNKKQEYKIFVDDTTGEYAQYTDAKKILYDEWFTSLKYQLDGDVAGNLQNQINDIAAKQVYLDARYIQEEEILYFPMKDAEVVEQTLFL